MLLYKAHIKYSFHYRQRTNCGETDWGRRRCWCRKRCWRQYTIAFGYWSWQYWNSAIIDSKECNSQHGKQKWPNPVAHICFQWWYIHGIFIECSMFIQFSHILETISTFLGSRRLSDLLIRSGANVDALDQNMMSPLHSAADAEKGKPLFKTWKYLWLLLAFWCADEDRIVELLVRSKADVNMQNIDGLSPLHLAAAKGSLNAICYVQFKPSHI